MSNDRDLRNMVRQRRRRALANYPSTPEEKACSRFAHYAADRVFVLTDGRRARIRTLILSPNATEEKRDRFGHAASMGIAILATYEVIEDDRILAEKFPQEFDGFPILSREEQVAAAA